MTCVDGERKRILITAIVSTIDDVTRTMVNRRYLPMSGVASDVGGLISTTNSKKMLRELRIVIPIVIFSPDSDGR